MPIPGIRKGQHPAPEIRLADDLGLQFALAKKKPGPARRPPSRPHQHFPLILANWSQQQDLQLCSVRTAPPAEEPGGDDPRVVGHQ